MLDRVYPISTPRRVGNERGLEAKMPFKGHNMPLKLESQQQKKKSQLENLKVQREYLHPHIVSSVHVGKESPLEKANFIPLVL